MKQKIGKLVGNSLYIHRNAIDHLDSQQKSLIEEAFRLAPAEAQVANVVRVEQSEKAVGLLNYPNFFEEAFPDLHESWKISLDPIKISYRTFQSSINPPILHRKELLIGKDHPQYGIFEKLTKQAEDIGLFTDTNVIGFRRNWEDRIRASGYVVIDHAFQPIGNDSTEAAVNVEPFDTIQRHRTALSRTGLSAPMQTLARNGLIDPKYTFFDYGCGKGDDLAALSKSGFDAKGWDPHYASENPKIPSDVVNLGFVINVIESIQERVEALLGAFSLTNRLLVVSTMLYGSTPPAGKPYRDGFLTQRNTFQKYFSQEELKEFIESALNTDAIPAAPGIMFVFKDKDLEQSYLYGRQRNRHTHELLGFRHERQQRIRPERLPRESKAARLIRENKDLIDSLWSHIMDLGRDPEQDEFANAPAAISVFGSWRKALTFTKDQNDFSELESSAAQRREDLIVYLALQLFSKRKPYRHLDTRLQRDIKALFGDYQKALSVSQDNLAKIAEPSALHEACVSATQKGLGFLSDEDQLQLHSSLVEQLPALLRIYVGCGSILYGDIYDVDLVKIHTRSGKVTFMKFDDFAGSPIPRMLDRIKISLKKQKIDFFKYGGEFPAPPLYLKSRYINEDFPKYAEQLEFDQAISKLNVIDEKSYGPSFEELAGILSARRLKIIDFSLTGETTIPDLDTSCGRYFKYRDLIECGETWEKTRLDNVPKNPETYNALNALCVNLLDPIIDYFGMIKLTYGFCSPQLARKIKGRIAPSLDQHASHELNKAGNTICGRAGAAVDFLVEDENMALVVSWIAENAIFDRIYYYGKNSPIHLSYCKHPHHEIIIMQPSKNHRNLIPKKSSLREFNLRIGEL